MKSYLECLKQVLGRSRPTFNPLWKSQRLNDPRRPPSFRRYHFSKPFCASLTKSYFALSSRSMIQHLGSPFCAVPVSMLWYCKGTQESSMALYQSVLCFTTTRRTTPVKKALAYTMGNAPSSILLTHCLDFGILSRTFPTSVHVAILGARRWPRDRSHIPREVDGSDPLALIVGDLRPP